MEDLTLKIKSIAPTTITPQMVDLHSQLTAMNDYELSVLNEQLECNGFSVIYDLISDVYEIIRK